MTSQMQLQQPQLQTQAQDQTQQQQQQRQQQLMREAAEAQERQRATEREEVTTLGLFANYFFKPPGKLQTTMKKEPEGRLFVTVEVDATTGVLNRDEAPIYLEGVDADWLTQAVAEDSHLAADPWNFFLAAPLAAIQIDPQQVPPPRGQYPHRSGVAWYQLRYSASSVADADAVLYSTLLGEGVPIRVSEFLPVPDPSRMPNLKGFRFPRVPSLDPKEFRRRARKALHGATTGSEGIVAYDVGQGTCQALLERSDHALLLPSLYLDFGGGVLGNAKTFPEGLKGFCFNFANTIVLSHWDWDHWSSLAREQASWEAVWIAPRPPERPIQLAAASFLASKGNLLLWPERGCARTSVGPVTLSKCTGTSTNDSGIAVIVTGPARQHRKALLPGDAAYQFIPSIDAAKYGLLAMTHHGGRLKGRPMPQPSRGASLLCSVGTGNSYGHPFLETIDAHVAGQWPFPLFTGAAMPRPCHLYAAWNGGVRAVAGVCHEQKCASAISRGPYDARVRHPSAKVPQHGNARASKAGR